MMRTLILVWALQHLPSGPDIYESFVEIVAPEVIDVPVAYQEEHQVPEVGFARGPPSKPLRHEPSTERTPQVEGICRPEHVENRFATVGVLLSIGSEPQTPDPLNDSVIQSAVE